MELRVESKHNIIFLGKVTSPQSWGLHWTIASWDFLEMCGLELGLFAWFFPLFILSCYPIFVVVSVHMLFSLITYSHACKN